MGCQLSAVSGWLGLSEAKPRSFVVGPTVASSRCNRDSVTATRKKVKIHRGGPQRAAEKRRGFRVQEWEVAAFPNPEPLCLVPA